MSASTLPSSADSALLAHVARLYYVSGMAQRDIATRFGMSRFKIARLLERARVEGVIRFDIAEAVPLSDQLSRKLEREFGLELGIVVEGDDVDAVAAAAAQWVPRLAPDGGSLGVAWGTTLSRVAMALPRVSTGTPVVQICGAIAGLDPGTGPAELALQFGERLGGPVYPLPAPALASASTHKELARDPTVAPTVAQWRRLGAALVGIGSARQLRGAPTNAVGHLLVHTYSLDGQQLAPSGGKVHAFAASWNQLRRTRLFAVASGEAKHQAVHGALRTGLLNGLFCDASLASKILEGVS